MNKREDFDMLLEELEKENIIRRKESNKNLVYVDKKFRYELIKQISFYIDKVMFLPKLYDRVDIADRIYYCAIIKTYLKNASISENKSIKIDELYNRIWIITSIILPDEVYRNIDINDFGKIAIETAVIDATPDELQETRNFILNNADSLKKSVIKVFYPKKEDRVRLYIE